MPSMSVDRTSGAFPSCSSMIRLMLMSGIFRTRSTASPPASSDFT